MVIEADRNGCVHEVMVIASVLSIADPRERPTDKQQQADEKHARFKDPASDFLALLNLWNYLTEQQKALSSNQFRKLCRNEFLNYLRVREWQDLYSQLRQTAKQLQPEPDASRPATPDPRRSTSRCWPACSRTSGSRSPRTRSARLRVPRRPRCQVLHRARVGAVQVDPALGVRGRTRRDDPAVGARGRRRSSRSGSSASPSTWSSGSYSEPHWSKKQAAVIAYEKVMLYGIPIVVARRVNYGRIDPVLSRELFIRHALVEGDWDTHHAFFAANRELLDEVEELEHRARRRDILVDDETLYDVLRRSASRPTWSPAGTSTRGGSRLAGTTRPARLRRRRCSTNDARRRGSTRTDYPDQLGGAGA